MNKNMIICFLIIVTALLQSQSFSCLENEFECWNGVCAEDESSCLATPHIYFDPVDTEISEDESVALVLYIDNYGPDVEELVEGFDFTLTFNSNYLAFISYSESNLLASAVGLDLNPACNINNGQCQAGCGTSTNNECHFGSGHAALFEVVFELINIEELYSLDINSLQISLSSFWVNETTNLANYVTPFTINIDYCDEDDKDSCGVCPNNDNLNDVPEGFDYTHGYGPDCNGDCLIGTPVGNQQASLDASYLGGQAVLDDCNICSGGNSGHVLNSSKDDCDVCPAESQFGCFNGDINCNCTDCAGVPNGTNDYDCNGECSCSFGPDDLGFLNWDIDWITNDVHNSNCNGLWQYNVCGECIDTSVEYSGDCELELKLEHQTFEFFHNQVDTISVSLSVADLTGMEIVLDIDQSFMKLMKGFTVFPEPAGEVFIPSEPLTFSLYDESNEVITDGCALPENTIYLLDQGSGTAQLLYNSSSEIGGFQLLDFTEGSALFTAYGGASDVAGFDLSILPDQIIASSPAGNTVPSGCGVLINLVFDLGQFPNNFNFIFADENGEEDIVTYSYEVISNNEEAKFIVYYIGDETLADPKFSGEMKLNLVFQFVGHLGDSSSISIESFKFDSDIPLDPINYQVDNQIFSIVNYYKVQSELKAEGRYFSDSLSFNMEFTNSSHSFIFDADIESIPYSNSEDNPEYWEVAIFDTYGDKMLNDSCIEETNVLLGYGTWQNEELIIHTNPANCENSLSGWNETNPAIFKVWDYNENIEYYTTVDLNIVNLTEYYYGTFLEGKATKVQNIHLEYFKTRFDTISYADDSDDIVKTYFIMRSDTAQIAENELNIGDFNKPHDIFYDFDTGETYSLSYGDAIGVFDLYGYNAGCVDCSSPSDLGQTLVGTRIFRGEENFEIPIYSSTRKDGDIVDGFISGHPLTLAVYDADQREAYFPKIFIETTEGQIDSAFSIKFGMDDIYDTDVNLPNVYDEELHVVAIIDEIHPPDYFNQIFYPYEDNFQTIVFTPDIETLQVGDEIGIFDNFGVSVYNENPAYESIQGDAVLVGAGIWQGNDLAINAVQAIDNTLDGGSLVPGFLDGNNIEIRVFRDNTIFDAVDINFYDTVGNTADGIFSEGDTLYVDDLGELGINSAIIPEHIKLFPCYPNPFNPDLNIKYEVPYSGVVDLKVYDIRGKLVEELFKGYQFPGEYSTIWSANDISSGIYFIKMNALNQIQTRKVILLK